MVKILMLFYQPVVDLLNHNAIICYYDSLAKELVDCGNEVKLLNFCGKTNNNFIVEKVKNFSPDLILSFNNRITKKIIECTNCPIACVEADSADMFANKELITDNLERYFLINFYDGFNKEEYKKLGFTENKICKFTQATSVQRQDLEKVNNISFIGSCFSSLSQYYDLSQLDRNKFIEYLKKYYENNYDNFDCIEKFCKKCSDIFEIYSMLDSRLYVLNYVWDLGLKLYGVRWNLLSNENLILKLLYDDTPVYSLRHNEEIYNSSVVNLSINHPQCKGEAFPWRCFDIMASSGLLISSYSKNLKEKTKGFVDIPMYNSPAEARDLCKYALENPNYVKDVSLASNAFVEENCRWKYNFKKLEEFTHIKLINEMKNRNLTYEIINVLSQSIKDKEKLSKKTFCQRMKFKQRGKNIFYLSCLILAQIPVVDLLFKKERRQKLLNKVMQYWR